MTITVPENLDDLTAEQMMIIAEQMNAIEPGSGVVHVAVQDMSFWVELTAAASVTALILTISVFGLPKLLKAYKSSSLYQRA